MKSISIVLFALFLTCFARADLNSGLVAYYPFDGDGSNSAGPGLDLNNHGATFVQSVLGVAASFDGTGQYFQTSDNFPIVGNTPRSISVWLKPYNIVGHGNLVGWGIVSGGALWNLHLDPVQSGRALINAATRVYYSGPAPFNFALGTWLHLVMTYDGTLIRFYVNGNDAGGYLYSSGPAVNTQSSQLLVGYINPGGPVDGGWSSPWNGLMKDLRIYNRVLTLEEVGILAGAQGSPEILQQPQDQQGYKGGSVEFSVNADAVPAPEYFWYKDGVLVAQGTNYTLRLENLQPDQAGNYWVTVSNSAGAVTSSNAVLVVNPPDINAGLVAYYPFDGNGSNSAAPGLDLVNHGATYVAGLSGQAASFDGTGEYFETSANFPITNNVSRSISVWLMPKSIVGHGNVVGWGVVASGALWDLHMDPAQSGDAFINAASPLFYSGPGPFSFSLGTWIHLVVTYDATSGTAAFYLNGYYVGGYLQTAGPPINTQPSHLLIGHFQPGSLPDGGWSAPWNGLMDDLRIYDRAITADEVAILAGVQVPPDITSQPAAALGYLEGSVQFNVVAEGVPVPGYLWYKNGGPISWATNATLTLTNLSISDAGDYRVVVANSAGSVTSSIAPLTINSPDTNAGLVAFYSFDGNGSNSASHSLDLTAHGVTYVNGLWGLAASFDGSGQYFETSQNFPITSNSSRSISVSLKPKSINGHGNIAGWGTLGGGNLWDFLLDPPQSGLALINADTRVYYSGPDPFQLSLGQWVNLAMTYDSISDRIRFFLNGKDVGGYLQSPGPPINTQPAHLLVGYFNPGTPPGSGWLAAWNGLMKDLKIYNRVLSQAEVASLVTLAAPVINQQPVSTLAYWGGSAHFDVDAESMPGPEYLWYKDGAAIPWATNATLTLTNLDFTDAGNYWVVVSNGLGSVTSSTAFLVVNPPGLSMGFHPFLSITGVVGRYVTVQSTTTLEETNSWITVTNFMLTSPVQEWVDSAVTAGSGLDPHRFYRIIVPPGP